MNDDFVHTISFYDRLSLFLKGCEPNGHDCLYDGRFIIIHVEEVEVVKEEEEDPGSCLSCVHVLCVLEIKESARVLDMHI